MDIFVELSMMSSHLELPSTCHLEQVLHMLRYLNKCHNSEMVFDPSEPYVSHKYFKHEDWSSSIYGDIKEVIPPNMP